MYKHNISQGVTNWCCRRNQRECCRPRDKRRVLIVLGSPALALNQTRVSVWFVACSEVLGFNADYAPSMLQYTLCVEGAAAVSQQQGCANVEAVRYLVAT